MRRALLSVSDKSGLVEFARGLAARGFELVSTGGTASALAAAGLAVTNVSDVTGFPEMMDGRVKTLHPKVHGGILARRARGRTIWRAAAGDGIGLIDVVVVNLYPFARDRRQSRRALRRMLIEQIDIGGPSLVRAAAKNFRDVLVVVDPADYPAVLAALDAPAARRARSASSSPAARSRTPRPTTRRSRRCSRPLPMTAPAPTRGPLPLAPARLVVEAAKLRDLRYGENPHQPAALVRGRRRARPRSGPRAAGQGALLHEPARSRRRGPHRRSSSTSRRRW